MAVTEGEALSERERERVSHGPCITSCDVLRVFYFYFCFLLLLAYRTTTTVLRTPCCHAAVTSAALPTNKEACKVYWYFYAFMLGWGRCTHPIELRVNRVVVPGVAKCWPCFERKSSLSCLFEPQFQHVIGCERWAGAL